LLKLLRNIFTENPIRDVLLNISKKNVKKKTGDYTTYEPPLNKKDLAKNKPALIIYATVK